MCCPTVRITKTPSKPTHMTAQDSSTATATPATEALEQELLHAETTCKKRRLCPNNDDSQTSICLLELMKNIPQDTASDDFLVGFPSISLSFSSDNLDLEVFGNSCPLLTSSSTTSNSSSTTTSSSSSGKLLGKRSRPGLVRSRTISSSIFLLH